MEPVFVTSPPPVAMVESASVSRPALVTLPPPGPAPMPAAPALATFSVPPGRLFSSAPEPRRSIVPDPMWIEPLLSQAVPMRSTVLPSVLVPLVDSLPDRSTTPPPQLKALVIDTLAAPVSVPPDRV